MLHRGNPPQRGRDIVTRVQGREAVGAFFNSLPVAKQRHSIAPDASPRFVGAKFILLSAVGNRRSLACGASLLLRNYGTQQLGAEFIPRPGFASFLQPPSYFVRIIFHRGNPPQRGRDIVTRVQGREAAAAFFNSPPVAKQRHSIAPDASPRFEGAKFILLSAVGNRRSLACGASLLLRNYGTQQLGAEFIPRPEIIFHRGNPPQGGGIW